MDRCMDCGYRYTGSAGFTTTDDMNHLLTCPGPDTDAPTDEELGIEWPPVEVMSWDVYTPVAA